MTESGLASATLAVIGVLIAAYPDEGARAQRWSGVVGGMFCLPALVRLWILALGG